MADNAPWHALTADRGVRHVVKASARAVLPCGSGLIAHAKVIHIEV
jgi:hypothetical protein